MVYSDIAQGIVLIFGTAKIDVLKMIDLAATNVLRASIFA